MMNLVPEKYFPLKKNPDITNLLKKIGDMKTKVKRQDYTLSWIERDRLGEVLKYVEELRRRFEDEYIYYFIPNKAQMKFVRAVVYGRVLRGGNKLGKTEVLIYDYVLKCLGIHPAQKLKMFTQPPVFARIICPDFQGSIKAKMRPTITKFIPSAELLRFDGDTYTFHFKNGSLLELKSNEQDIIKFASVDRHLIGMDEPVREEIFGENLTRLATYRGSWDMTQTPIWKDKNPWIKRLISPHIKTFPEAGNMAGTEVGGRGITEIRGTWRDNSDNLDPVGVKEWLSTLSDAERLIRDTGDFPEGASFLFGDSFIKGIHSCIPFKVPENRVKFRAVDMGIGCPTVCLWAFVGDYEDRSGGEKNLGLRSNPILYIYREYYQRGKTIPENAGKIADLSKDELIEMTFLDPKSGSKRDEQTGLTRQTQWTNTGITTILGAINVEAGLNEIASMMLWGEKSLDKRKYPKIVVFSNCVETIKELLETSVDDLKKVDSMHCISCLRWLAASKIVDTWNNYGNSIPGAYYGEDGKKEYEQKHRYKEGI